MEKKRQFPYDILSSIFFYILAGVIFAEASSIKDPLSRVFPLIVSGLAILLATIVLLTTIFSKNRPTYDFSGSKTAFIFGIILVVYVTITAYFGFYIATPIYLAFTTWYLGQKSWKAIIGSAIGTTLAIYLFFDLLFEVPIPMGIFIKMWFPQLF